IPVTLSLDPAPSTPQLVYRNAYQAQLFPGRTYNVVRAMTEPQAFINGTLDMTGRFNQTSVFASVAGLDQGGSIRYLQGFQRYSGRLNVDQRMGSAWTASLRTYFGRNNQDGLQTGNNNNGAFFSLTRMRAISNLLQTDTLGRLYIRSDMQASGGSNSNPLYDFQNRFDRQVIDRF